MVEPSVLGARSNNVCTCVLALSTKSILMYPAEHRVEQVTYIHTYIQVCTAGPTPNSNNNYVCTYVCMYVGRYTS